MELYHQKSPSIDYGGRTKGGLQTGIQGTSTRERVPLPSYRKEKGRKGLTTYSGTITRHGSTVC